MTIFKTIKEMATKTAKDAVKFSGDAVEYTKLNYKLSELKDDLKETYAQIGMLVYQSSGSEDTDKEKIEELYARVAELNDEIEILTSSINAMSSRKICASCGAKMPAESNFCPKCGEKAEE